MKKVNNMSDLFERLNDLKVVFFYGQKFIPIIQSIIDFMSETVPLLEDINTSISDSTNKIPKAKDQIDNVTNATELATTEILDTVDLISAEIEKIENELKTIQAKEEERKMVWEQIKEVLNQSPNSAGLIERYEAIENIYTIIPRLLIVFSKTKNDVNNIALSLQVQDITSQQLASVNHLIESVRQRLASLVMHLDESDIKDIESIQTIIPDTAAFNPDAIYTKSREKQEAADILVNNRLNKTSQDEIDKLFS
ncbi:MAG TPA: protein phosphatase CheZ [Ignavibacteriaceae bacterium]|nr:protein phosphatase CheZ [Ignavibacteriaceae bacterium]